MDDATSLAAAIAAGHLTSVDAMQASLDAAEKLSDLGALARVEPELGLARAAEADSQPMEGRGPFHGVPFLAKDLGSYGQGLAPLAGSPALAPLYADPEDDDDLFQAFRASDLVPFGLTTVPEFGLALTSEPPGRLPARNPWNTDFSPGGSSGGAAAAVAAGIVALAHATDAAGSTRVPAACCGLIGLKPSRGRIPGGPHFNNHLMGIAAELVVARSVRDVQTAFEAVKTPATGSDRPIKRIGLALSPRCSNTTNTRTQKAAEQLSALGYELTDVGSLDSLGLEAHKLARTVFRVGLANWLGMEGLGADDVTPIAFAIAEEGQALSPMVVYTASKEMARLTHEAGQLFSDVDAVLCPVLADGPPKVGAFDANQTDPEARFDEMEAVAPNVALANVAGLPALSVPFGMMDDLPFGVQIISPQGSDEAILKVAQDLQASQPPLSFPYPIAGLS